MYRNLTVMAAAALVVLGFASHAYAQGAPTPIFETAATITDPQFDIDQFKIDIAVFRTQCTIAADDAGAVLGFIRPGNIHDDPVLTRDLCEIITGNECIIWLCFLVD